MMREIYFMCVFSFYTLQNIRKTGQTISETNILVILQLSSIIVLVDQALILRSSLVTCLQKGLLALITLLALH